MPKGLGGPVRFQLVVALPIFVLLAAVECFLIFAPTLGVAVSHWTAVCGVGLFVVAGFAWHFFPEDRPNG
jgi:hypothetical protein